jgi:integrase
MFSQVITEFNRVKHVQVDDSRALKRPFTPVELQQFFDLADLEPERILHAGRKGALSAWRDAVAFKTLYGCGLRRNEVRYLQLVDFSRNARAPFFG